MRVRVEMSVLIFMEVNPIRFAQLNVGMEFIYVCSRAAKKSKSNRTQQRFEGQLALHRLKIELSANKIGSTELYRLKRDKHFTVLFFRHFCISLSSLMFCQSLDFDRIEDAFSLSVL